MKKFYSFLFAATCFLLCGNVMAQDPVSVSDIVQGQKYNIKHVNTGYYLNFLDHSDGDFNINTLVSGSDVFDFTFTPVAGSTNTYNIGVSGQYINGSGWNMQLGTQTGINGQIQLIQNSDNFTMKTLWSNNVNSNSEDAGSRVYADKGTGAVFQLVLSGNALSDEELILVLKTAFGTKIAEAEETLNTGSNFFPEDAKTVFQGAISTAESFYENIDEDTNIADIIAEISSLEQAIETYLASAQITPFTPDPAKRYRIAIADASKGYCYTNSTVTNRQVQMKTGISSDQLFNFEAFNGGYKIKPLALPDSALYARYTGASGGTNSGYNSISTAKNEGEGINNGSKFNDVSCTFSFINPTLINGVPYYNITVTQGTTFAYFDNSILRTRASLQNANTEKFTFIEDGLVVKTALGAKITEAEGLYNAEDQATGQEITEGTAAGKYTQEAKGDLNTAIGVAQSVFGDDEADQAAVDAAAAALQTAINTYLASVLGDKTALNAAIMLTEGILAATTVGDQTGNYLQAVADSLSAAVDDAVEVRDNLTASQIEVNAALTVLNAVIAYVQNNIIYLVDTDKAYYIVNKGGNYLGRANEAQDTRVSTRSTDKTAADVYTFTLIAVGGEPGVYNIKRSTTDEYVATSSSYEVYLKELVSGEYIKIRLLDAGEEHLKLRFIEKSGNNNFLGANNTGTNQNTASDKNGNDDAHLWKLENTIITGVGNPGKGACYLFVSDRNLNIAGLGANAKISVFDITGRMLFSEVAEAASYSRMLPSAGSYIVSIEQAEQRKSSVILVK